MGSETRPADTKMWLLAVFIAIVATTSALTLPQDINGVEDDLNDAVVVEAYRADENARDRKGRQFGLWAPAGQGMSGMFPASTVPLSPLAQALCPTQNGGFTWCQQNYQWWAPPQQPAAFPGAGQYPWWQQQPGLPGIQQPVQPAPVQPAPVKPAPVQTTPVPTTQSPTTEAPAVAVGESEPPLPAPAAGCGVGKYYPIRYNGNGSVAEEIERIYA